MAERKIDYTFKDRAAASREFGHLAHYCSEILGSLKEIRANADHLWLDPSYILCILDDLGHASAALRDLTVRHLGNWLYATSLERIDAELAKDIKAVLSLLSESLAELDFARTVAMDYSEHDLASAPREKRVPYASKISWAVYRLVFCDRASGYKDDPVAYLDVIGEKILELPEKKARPWPSGSSSSAPRRPCARSP